MKALLEKIIVIFFCLSPLIISINLEGKNPGLFKNIKGPLEERTLDREEEEEEEYYEKGEEEESGVEDFEIIYLNGETNGRVVLNKTNNRAYYFVINNTNYVYFFESEINGYMHYNGDIPCPNICAVNLPQSGYNAFLVVNYYRNATEKNITIEISSFRNFKGEISSIILSNNILSAINPLTVPKSIILFEGYSDYIFYFNKFDESMSVKCTEYSKEMDKLDILNVNPKYFKNCNNKINDLKSNKIYIFAITSSGEINRPVKILLQPKILNEDILIYGDETNFLYLSGEKNIYTLDFSHNDEKRSIQLSRLTSDSEITIEDPSTNEQVKLNKDNLYYKFNDDNYIFTGKLNIIIENKKNALIEFTFKYDEENTEVLTEKEYTNHSITKEITIIKFDNNDNRKYIKFKLFSQTDDNFEFSMVSGYTKGNYFHKSSSNNYVNLKRGFPSSEISLYYDNITLEENESFYLALIFEKEKLDDNTYIIGLNKTDIFTLDDINVEISEEKCKIIIDNLIQLFKEAYIYTDIKKNTPDPEYFGNADIISDLNNVQTSDRKYYDFYRDIKRIIGKTKDNLLQIYPKASPNGYNLSFLLFFLPFSLYIDGENFSDAKMYIGQSYFKKYFSPEIRDFIDNHLGKPLKSINNTDPFDYIQNINKEFDSSYNKHSTFTLNYLGHYLVSIASNPLLQKDLSNIPFVFENNDTVILDYYLPNPDIPDESNEFITFYDKINKKKGKTLKNKSFFKKEDEYNRIKNNLEENTNDNIEWQYSTSNNGLKCRVDENNKYNVLIILSFLIYEPTDYNDFLNILENCTELFYSNPYPIIGIESINNGESARLSYYLEGLLQVKVLPVYHISAKMTDLINNLVEGSIKYNNPDMYQRIDIETCKPFNKSEEMKTIEDDYGNNVKHIRSQPFGIINSTDSKEFKKRRQKYFEMKNLKKPTEIIIFTDSYSRGEASFFNKGIQETGSAILVGYMGNPKLNETFDTSQSPSFSVNFDGTEIYKNLFDAGFEIGRVSIYESFNYTYQKQNPTPRDYLINPVDERVSIYQIYSDSLYDKFISEATKIFKKYNKDQECNPDNLNLVYEPDGENECYIFENNPHAHGGYMCDTKTKKWSKICKPYYCDIGYYFDTYQNKCIKDNCTENEGENENEDEDEDENENENEEKYEEENENKDEDENEEKYEEENGNKDEDENEEKNEEENENKDKNENEGENGESDTNNDKEGNNGGIKAWHISLIVIGGIIILGVFIVIIIKCRKKNTSVVLEETGPLIDNEPVELK